MKKIIFLAAAISLVTACHKEPYPQDRDGEFLVYTVKGDVSDFSGFTTYYIADEVMVVGENGKAEASTTSNALSLVNEVRKMMESRGYTYEADKTLADLGLQLTYMEETTRYLNYVSDPYWWLDYPGYWGSGYWGNYGGWYHPYPVTYTYSTTSLVLDMVDRTAVQGEDQKLPVIWSAFIGGETGYANRDVFKLRAGIDQAFVQSSYIEKK